MRLVALCDASGVTMAEDLGKSRLGRGLAALLGDVSTEPESGADRGRAQLRVPIEFLRPNARNPRRSFPEAELDQLAGSIRERGVIQAILVRTARGGGADAYEIIAGERRWRAAQRAGVHTVPVVVLQATDQESLELAIVENVQRTDLNALEEAMGYRALAQDFGHSTEEIARVVGKSRSHVANFLRLLQLPDSVKTLLSDGRISAGHARALLALPDPEGVAEQIIAHGWNVRQVEALAQADTPNTAKPRKLRGAPRDADTAALEQRLSDHLGLSVSILVQGSRGELRVRYRSLDQLEDVVRRLEG